MLFEHCDNGMGFPSFKMVAQHVTSIGPDAVGSQYERVSTYRISRVLPPRYLDHYVCERLAPGIPFKEPFGDYEYRSQIFGGPMILMTDIMALEEGSGRLERAGAGDRSREADPATRDRGQGAAPARAATGRAGRRRLGWLGRDRLVSSASDTAVILAFRLGGDLDERVIPVHGLNPASSYRITFEDRPDQFERSGAEIMEAAIELALPGNGQPRIVDGLGFVRASEVIHLDPIS